MNELVNVKRESKDTMTSLELLEQINFFRKQFDDKTVLEHKTLLRTIRDEFEEEIGENKIVLTYYKDVQGKDRPMFELTLSQAKQVLVRESKSVRKAVIAYIEELENKLKEQKLPQTYLEALKALVASEEEKEKLRSENRKMLPKAEYFDNLVDRNLLTNFRDTAKELKIKEKIFIKWLEDRGFIYRDKQKRIKPTADFITGEKKYFELKEWGNTATSGTQTLITPRGRETFRLLYEMEKNK